MLEGLREGLLFDPAAERFQSRQSLRREAEGYKFEASVYLYSQHQLACLWPVRWLLQTIRWRQRSHSLVATLPMEAELRAKWLEQAQALRNAAIAVTALEPVYFSGITGTLSTPLDFDIDAFLRWRFELEPRWLLDWLSVSSDWVRERASDILGHAQRLDDLGRWSEVIGAGSAKRWDELRGTPRLVLDMRIAGELLLKYYDGLIREENAPPLPAPPRTATPYDLRLKRRRPLDAILTDFGLSPHPQLILIVEGRTERLLVPRAMRKLGLPTDDDFISVQDAEGVDANLGPLLAYLAPQPGDDENERYVRPLRPLTRFLIVFDPEGPVVSDADREQRRQIWIDRIMRALPQEMQTAIVREQIERLVAIRTWNRRGESFEYAHFTNLQLARAIDKLDRRPRKPPRERLVALISDARAANRNLKSLLHGSGKTDLAEALWPALERRLDAALANKTETRIPVVRVIDEAQAIAQEFGRGNTVIALTPH
ncbi:MAG TPA: hypothetical protein VFM96_14490 [Gaiellaceae bacterium]|nr:hypothetical protein [Gaiellaceae bacterium]